MFEKLFSSKKPIQQPLPFSVGDCEKRDISLAPSNILIELDEKTVIYIDQYYQQNINAGIICGMPSDLEPYFKYSVDFAQQCLEYDKDNSIYYIKPHIYTDISSSDRETFLLPSIFTCAVLNKNKQLDNEKNPDLYMSSIRIGWWQDTVGNPDPYIIEILKTLVWKEPYAWSWAI
jgi:hypothetical protein